MAGRPKTGLELRRSSAMAERGLTQTFLAARWGCRQPFVSALLAGHERSWDKELDFAALCGAEHAQLWEPHPHHGHGERIAATAPGGRGTTPGAELAVRGRASATRSPGRGKQEKPATRSGRRAR